MTLGHNARGIRSTSHEHAVSRNPSSDVFANTSWCETHAKMPLGRNNGNSPLSTMYTVGFLLLDFFVCNALLCLNKPYRSGSCICGQVAFYTATIFGRFAPESKAVFV